MKQIYNIILMLALLTAGAITTQAQNPFADEPIQNVPSVSQPTTGSTTTTTPARPNSQTTTTPAKPNSQTNTGNTGLVFKYGDLHYKIRSDKAVEVTGEVRGSYKGRVEIPNIVKHDGKTYQVVGIGQGAFAHQAKMTQVVIPKSVQYIEGNAFSFANLLTEVTIPGDKVKVKKNAFLSCQKLQVVTINGKKPQCSSSAFQLCWKMKELRIRGISASNNGKKLNGTNAVIKVIK